MNIRRFFKSLLFFFWFLFLSAAAGAAKIDVMIVYDSTAKTWVQSNGGINLFAQDAIARMNQAMQDSGIDLEFNLVHAADVAYTHTDFGSDLGALQAGTGTLASVHTLRNTYGADLVAMMVDTGSAYGTVGLGYVLSSSLGSPAYGFTVNAIQSVEISHTMTHETGHNLGADHSKFQFDSPGPNDSLNTYSAGWYFTGTDGVGSGLQQFHE